MQTKMFVGLMVYAVLHIFLWSANPPDVDPINFVTALQHYNVAIDSPHPPGYPGYVGLARIASMLVAANHAYQLVNLFLVISTALLVYYSLVKLGMETEAWVSALIILSHPLLLSSTLVQESYVSDACLGACILAWVIFSHRNSKLLLVGLILFFYLFGLFRVVSDVLLLPLTLALVWRFSDDKLLTLKAMVLILLACFLAWLTTVALAGGYEIYKTAVDRVMVDAVKSSSILAGASLDNHIRMLVKLGIWLFFSTIPLLLVCFGVGIFSNGIEQKYKEKSFDNRLALAWVLPPLAFYVFVYYLKPTYLLIFLPVYAIYLASSLKKLAFYFKMDIFKPVLLLFIGLQLSLFFTPNKSWPQSIYRESYSYMLAQDSAWEELKQAVKPIPRQNTLLVWHLGPGLSMYTLRLLDVPYPVAIIHASHKTIEFVEPHDMRWLPPQYLSAIHQNQYHYIAELIERHGHIVAKVTEIKPDETRSLDEFVF